MLCVHFPWPAKETFDALMRCAALKHNDGDLQTNVSKQGWRCIRDVVYDFGLGRISVTVLSGLRKIIGTFALVKSVEYQ
jgi:hypothetical protein